MTRRVLAFCCMLPLLGCSDGAAPVGTTAGYFTARLTGSQSLRLGGLASTFNGFTEPDSVSGVFMVETPGHGERRSISLACLGQVAPGVGTHAIGSAAQCNGFYSRTIGTPSTGLALDEGLDTDTGSVTITRQTDQELAGSFTLHGTLTSFGNPVGPLTVTGTFRARPEG